MNTEKPIFELCAAAGVSGREEPALETAERLLKGFCRKITRQGCGIVAELGNPSGDKTILLDAHIDRIGFMATETDENGFVRVSPCGGIDARVMADTALCLQSNPEITGVVCCMPPHLSDGREDKAQDKLWVDFGLPHDEVSRFVKFGDMLTFAAKPEAMLNGKVVSPCLDNRSGAAALIRCAELLKDKSLDYNVVILLSTQEETHGTGAKTGAFAVNADEAIVVDVSFASQPDITGLYSSIKLGGGSMICVSSILNRQMTDFLIETAENCDIPYQIEPIAGRTGTNADHISTARGGVKSAVVSIPQRYMHTQNEVVQLCDVDNTARLIAEYIVRGGAFGDRK